MALAPWNIILLEVSLASNPSLLPHLCIHKLLKIGFALPGDQVEDGIFLVTMLTVTDILMSFFLAAVYFYYFYILFLSFKNIVSHPQSYVELGIRINVLNKKTNYASSKAKLLNI